MHFCSCGSKDGFKVHENFQTAAFESTRNFKLTSQFPKMIFLFCFAFQTILAQKNTVIISGSKGLYENNLNAQRVVGQPRFNASCDEFSLHLAAQCEAWSKILIIIGYIIYIISKKYLSQNSYLSGLLYKFSRAGLKVEQKSYELSKTSWKALKLTIYFKGWLISSRIFQFRQISIFGHWEEISRDWLKVWYNIHNLWIVENWRSV